MSELSRLRERWIRLERLIVKLETDCEAAPDDEASALVEKIQVAKANLKATIAETHVEELRLMQPDSKLVFKLKPRKEKKPKRARVAVAK